MNLPVLYVKYDDVTISKMSSNPGGTTKIRVVLPRVDDAINKNEIEPQCNPTLQLSTNTQKPRKGSIAKVNAVKITFE